MKRNKELSMAVSSQKAEMIYNRIVPIFEDVMNEKIEVKKDSGEIETVVVLVLRDGGYERISTEGIDALGYITTLCKECKSMQKILVESVETEIRDFRGIEREFRKKDR